MSLAYKLWKIGSILTKQDIKEVLQEKAEYKNGEEPVNLNIDFKFKGNKISSITLIKDSVSKEKLFFSKKIGGTSNAYYLYPNIIVQNDIPIQKLGLLENTLMYSTKKYCSDNFIPQIDTILNEIKDIKEHAARSYCELQITTKDNEIQELIEKEKTDSQNEKVIKKKVLKLKKEQKSFENELKNILSKKDDNEWNSGLLAILAKISKLPKDTYWIWFSINGSTFVELMPEVWNNWYKEPVEADTLHMGYDSFTNKEIEVGYKPEVKVFSYDQYHDSLKYRINENLPLSLKSAGKIKFAWMYILENLVFYYKGLEYIIIPNLLTDDKEIYKLILERLKKANEKTSKKRVLLENLRKEENNLHKNIQKLKKEKKQDKKLEADLKNVIKKIDAQDLGIIQEFNEQLLNIEEHINSITIDYIFTTVNRTNLSFEIKGSIEDVIPSKLSAVVKKMRDMKISDLVKLGSRDRNETLLQDFFNRNELYFAVNRSAKNNSNKILEERLYLAKLLLTDMKIKLDDLLKRFEFNRKNDYGQKKRITKEKVQEWIEFPGSFVDNETAIINFLTSLNKIQE